MGDVDTPTLPELPGGPEGLSSRESAWTAKGSRRLNRLRAVVAKAMLKSPEGNSPVADAVGLLHRIAAGTEPATAETRVQAAGTLVRTAAALVAKDGAPSTVSIDARSVTLQVGQGKPTHTDLAAALRLLAASGAVENTLVDTQTHPAESNPLKNGKHVPGG